jgi:hypothetical protein
MAERRIVTKIAYDTSEVVKGAQAGRAALTSFADVSKTSTSALEREYRRLVSAISPAEKSQLAFARAVSVTNELVKKGRLTQEQANATLREAEQLYKRQASAVSGLGSIFQKFGAQMVAAFGAYQLLNIGKQAISEATEAAAAHALLANRVRETGGAAGFTAAQIDQMATALSGQLAIDNDIIKANAAILLQYRGITGDQFPRAIALAIDMASEQGKLVTSTEQLASKTELLGKMLANPERAGKLLAKSGKALDEQQHKSIQTFLRQNDLIGAQKVLFAELERQYGGNAKALRGEIGGAMQAAEVGWNNLLEAFGTGLLFDVTGVNDLSTALNDPQALKAAQDLGKAIGQMADNVLRLASTGDELDAFIGKLSNLQERWAEFWRDAKLPQWRPPPSFPLQPPAEAPGRSRGAAAPPPGPPSGGAPSGGVPFDPAAAEKARREAEAAQKRAEKLRETFAGILAEHELIRRKQAELLALYSRADLTVKTRKEGEEAINDRYADRVTHAKALKQFEDLGPARAREMAEQLVRVTAEERARGRVIEEQIKLAEDRWKREADFARNALDQIEEAARRSADRVEALWTNALDAIAEGTKPIRDAFKELGQLDAALDLERRSAAISAPTSQLEAIERDYLAFLSRVGEGSVAAGERAVAQLASVIGISVDEIKAKWGELADLQAIGAIRGAGSTPAERYRAETAELERLRQVAADKGLDMERDFEARRLQISTEFWDAQLSAWTGALDFLAGAFGGIFADLQRVANSYQQGKQAGSAIGDAVGIGAAAGGVAGGIVGIWVAAWQWFEGQGAKRRAQSYGPAAVVSGSTGNWDEHFTQLDSAQRRATAQVQETIDEFARVLGGTFSSFADLEIQVRRDGEFFHAFVEGALVGSFKDMASATEAAILAAFRNPETTLAGVSDLVRQGFTEAVARGVSGLSLGELTDFLGTLREINEISWTDGVRQMQETVRHFDELWDAMERLDVATAASAQARTDLIASEADAWRARFRSLTGEQESPEAQLARLRREGELQEAQLRMRIADLRLREIELKQEAEFLRQRAHLGGAGAQLRSAETRNASAHLQARAKLAEQEVNLYQAHLDAIAASLEAIAQLIAELERIDLEFDPGDIKLPDIGGGGRGGGAGVGQSLADLIAESRRAIAAADQSSYRQQLEAIKERWAEAIKAAEVPDGALARARKARDAAIRAADGNAEAIKRANEQYERQTRNIARSRDDLAAANAQREAEIALLQRQQRESAGRAQRDYVGGPNAFRDERQRAADLRAQWKDLLDTGAIKWREYKRAVDEMNVALEGHLRTLALQESGALFGQLAGLLDQAGLGESVEALALIRAQQQANFALQLAEANLRYAQLVAEGALIGANRDLVEDALRRLNELDIGALFGPPGPVDTRRFRGYDDAPTPTGPSASSLLDEAQRLRERYASAQEDPFARRLREINADFETIFASLGRGAENIELFRQTVEDAFADLTQPVQDWLNSMDLSAQSPLTGQQRLETASQQLDAIMARLAAGDFSAYGELAGAGTTALDLAAAQYGTATAEYQALYDRIRAMGQQALAMADATAANFSATGVPSAGSVVALPLGSGEIVSAIAAGTASTRDSLAVLRDIRSTSESWSYTIGVMARDIADLRVANETLARELAMLRESRAS